MSKKCNAYCKVIISNLLIFLFFYDCKLNFEKKYRIWSSHPGDKTIIHYSCLNQTVTRNDPTIESSLDLPYRKCQFN